MIKSALKKTAVVLLAASLPVLAANTAAAEAATHVYVTCHEYTGKEFRIGASPYSRRLDSTHVHLEFYSAIPQPSIKIYTENGFVYELLNAPAGLFNATFLAASPHNWSAGGAGGGSYDWVSNLGYGNHCGSNTVFVA